MEAYLLFNTRSSAPTKLAHALERYQAIAENDTTNLEHTPFHLGCVSPKPPLRHEAIRIMTQDTSILFSL